MRKKAAAFVVAGLLAMAHDAVAMSKCIDRDGRCMAVSVNGQQGVKLSKRTKSLLKDLQAVSYEVREARYEVPLPIQGPIEIAAERSADSGDWFGESRSFETMVVPLDQVDLNTRRELTTSDNVRIGGAAPVVAQDVIEGNRLPPGRYLLVITLRGQGNWDRMRLYVEVAD